MFNITKILWGGGLIIGLILTIGIGTNQWLKKHDKQLKIQFTETINKAEDKKVFNEKQNINKDINDSKSISFLDRLFPASSDNKNEYYTSEEDLKRCPPSYTNSSNISRSEANSRSQSQQKLLIHKTRKQTFNRKGENASTNILPSNSVNLKEFGIINEDNPCRGIPHCTTQ